MELELLSGRFSSSSASASLQASSFYSGGDSTWDYFPCPFCYVEVEIPVLCTHLQEEHCFDTKNAVCPVCADNLGKDMTAHFTLQHSPMLKRRRPQRNSLWADGQAPVERDAHELGSFRGAPSSAHRRGNAAAHAAPDPLLLSFVSYPDIIHDQEASSGVAASDDASTSHEKSLKPTMANKSLEHDLEEMNQRAEFFQQMLLSTIF
ncbi:protein DEHYDRATION-INDUCED 19-like protein 5-like isoform X1 [Iris pallida]|uniref:Protein DEHYDRATION-INDUCED 19-like protein 5-like isoform X1 n=1 Tax=Iris pallida TaxID=29817 RepID=A0AAX6HL42_IRIPA|nr:protein DEHYDRATION-INDUCED 19-like protein 5-like isoform X1 [Iris pallida]